jgi:hypothetical protein
VTPRASVRTKIRSIVGLYAAVSSRFTLLRSNPGLVGQVLLRPAAFGAELPDARAERGPPALPDSLGVAFGGHGCGVSRLPPPSPYHRWYKPAWGHPRPA